MKQIIPTPSPCSPAVRRLPGWVVNMVGGALIAGALLWLVVLGHAAAPPVDPRFGSWLPTPVVTR